MGLDSQNAALGLPMGVSSSDMDHGRDDVLLKDQNSHAEAPSTAAAAAGATEGLMHHGGQIGSYMALKISKLREQYESEALHMRPTMCSTLFAGVAIFVNGYTQPTAAELRQIMVMHGGRFEAYQDHQTTHVVCGNLPDTKIKALAHSRDPKPIVQPEWITASLKAGRLLPVKDFQLLPLSALPGQKRLIDFQTYATGSLPTNELYPQLRRQQPQPPGETSVLAQLESDPPRIGVLDAGVVSSAEELRRAQALCAQLRASCDALRGAPKTSRDDPNFVDSFFKSSRLHFIGQWRSRIDALLSDMECTGPTPRKASTRHTPGPLWAAPASANTVAQPFEPAIIHLDMDCFFASVTMSQHPILKGKPLCVSHSSSAQGRGEVSAANYEARAFGIKAAMPIGDAKNLCPRLLVVPYDFAAYEAVSEQVYRIMMSYSSCVQPLSCDEAFVDITGLGDPNQLAAAMRANIQEATGCAASVGIGPNLLVARLATQKAKPNGQWQVLPAQVMDFLADLPVEDLPGVGSALQAKLKELDITHVRQVRAVSKEQLQRQLGKSIGATVWAHAHGRDLRTVEPPKPRKSVGVEISWGVRFSGVEDMQRFLKELSQEVGQRLRTSKLAGKCITLKVKRRQEGAPAPWKPLGHGICDNLSRSTTLGHFTDLADEVLKECGQLLAALQLPFADVVGMGISVSRLNNDSAAQAARPSAVAPTRVTAPPTVYDPHKQRTWAVVPELTEGQGLSCRYSTDHGATPPASSGKTGATGKSPGSEPKRANITPSSQSDPRACVPGQGQLRIADMFRPQRMVSPVHRPASDATVPLPQSSVGNVAGTCHPEATRKRLFSEGAGAGAADSKPGKAAKKCAGSVSLPPASQLDPQVLAELPEDVRREVLAAYADMPFANNRPGKHAYVLGPPPRLKGTVGQRAVKGRAKQTSKQHAPRVVLPSLDMTASQLDLQVLSELPEDMQRELRAALRGHVHHPAWSGGSFSARASEHTPPDPPAVQPHTAAQVQVTAHPGAPSLTSLPPALFEPNTPPSRVMQSFYQAISTLMMIGAADKESSEAGCTGSPDAPLPEPLHTRVMLICELGLRWQSTISWDLEWAGICLAKLQALTREWRHFRVYASKMSQVVCGSVMDRYNIALQPISL